MILKEDAFYCYLWKDIAHPEICKFGDRWVKAGEDPEIQCNKRIRESLSVSKYLYDDGNIEVVRIWDVSEVAKQFNCFKKHGKVDISIGKIIGYNKQSDVYELPAEEFAVKVDDFLKSRGQQLPSCGLTQWQYNQVEENLQKYKEGARTFLLELCARFGKTIFGGAFIIESEIPLTIIVSYVLTSFTSFKNDLGRFQQFKNLELIEAGDIDYQEKVDDALKAGKQVVVFVSMCNGSKRQPRLDFLFSRECDRIIIADEPDFGMHKDGQTEPLKNGRKSNDVVILMTGTNGDKAASSWKIDHYSSVTYPELLIQKRETQQKLI